MTIVAEQWVGSTNIGLHQCMPIFALMANVTNDWTEIVEMAKMAEMVR